MEPHKELPGAEEYRPPLDGTASDYFGRALEFVRKFYPEQLEAFSKVKFAEVSPDVFYVEYVWVVHATGFSAKQVGKMMGRLIPAYGPFRELARLEEPEVMARVLQVCNNPQKARSVWTAAKLLRDGIDAFGWEGYRDDYLSSPELLRKLPYVGPVTCFHLARNIGLLEFVKPDLHLVRLAAHFGFKDPVEMCRAVRPDGMPLGIVDLIWWYAASTFGTVSLRGVGGR